MKLAPGFIFIGGGLVALASWFAALTGNLYGVTVDQLEPLYTGLGFVGLVATFWHERRESEYDEREHRELLRMMTDQANAARELTKENQELSRLSALIARIECYSAQLDETKPHMGGEGRKLHNTLYRERHELIQRLDSLLYR